MIVCGANPMTTEVDKFLPDIEKAREQGVRLPDVAPVSQTRLAAVVVMARAVRRDSWDQIVRDDSAAASIPAGEAPAPADYATRSHSRVIGRVRGGLRVRHYTDTGLSICDMHVPTIPECFAYEAALEQLAELGKVPPDCLRCHDLSPRTAGGSPYRGGGKLSAPDFHGYAFGDAIDKARGSIQRMGVPGTIFLREVVAWAWPFLWLHYPLQVARVANVILAPDARGRLSAIVDLGAVVPPEFDG